MQLDSLTPKNSRKVARRIGRGGKRGKMSGRGHKGQTARAGNSTRPEMREIIKKLPKLRGHGKNRAATVNNERVTALAVNVGALEANFEAGSNVTPAAVVAAGIVSSRRKKAPAIKILATGELTKKLTLSGFTVSAAAKAKIEKAGGTIIS